MRSSESTGPRLQSVDVGQWLNAWLCCCRWTARRSTVVHLPCLTGVGYSQRLVTTASTSPGRTHYASTSWWLPRSLFAPQDQPVDPSRRPGPTLVLIAAGMRWRHLMSQGGRERGNATRGQASSHRKGQPSRPRRTGACTAEVSPSASFRVLPRPSTRPASFALRLSSAVLRPRVASPACSPNGPQARRYFNAQDH